MSFFTLRILSAPIPNWHTEAILPYEDDSVVACSQSLFSDDLGTPEAPPDREWHGRFVLAQHLVFRTPPEEAALR